MARLIRKVAVIGGGTMGSKIGRLIAQKGIIAVVKEVSDDRAKACRNSIHGAFDQVARLGHLTSAESEAAKARFLTTDSFDEIKDADLVIEAVFEDIEVKKAVFRELNPLLPEDVIFTTNSSSLSIDEIASVTNRPNRFIGTHFFNPAHSEKAPLVELVKGGITSEETYDVVHRFVKKVLGKTPILVKGCPGYLVNRNLMPYANEAVRLIVETKLTVSDVDARARKFGWPMGPFALLDYVGNDIAANVAEILYAGYGERALPSPFIRRIVELGRIGDKVGAGFYTKATGFEDLSSVIGREYPNRINLDIEEGFKRMMGVYYNESFRMLEEEIASPDVIEKGNTLGIMFPMTFEGPLHYVQEKYGFANLLADLKRMEMEYGMRFKPAAILERLVAEDGKIFEKIEEEEW